MLLLVIIYWDTRLNSFCFMPSVLSGVWPRRPIVYRVDKL